MTRSGDRHGDTDAWVVLPPAELTARVASAPTPQIPLASIRHLLTPVYGADAELVDWRLFASGYDQHDAVSEFVAWRHSWRPHWAIGSTSNLARLAIEVAEIDHDLEDRRLDHLLAHLAALGDSASGALEVPVEHARALLGELETVRLALSVDDRTGHGIVDDMPALTRSAGLARTWAPSVDEVVLAATTATAVVLRGDDGLTVLHDGPAFRAFSNVRGVDLRGDTVVLVSARGDSLRIPLRDARPLGWLVPRSLRWHVVDVPIVAVWTPIFIGLADALRHAIRAGEPVVISGEFGVS